MALLEASRDLVIKGIQRTTIWEFLKIGDPSMVP